MSFTSFFRRIFVNDLKSTIIKELKYIYDSKILFEIFNDYNFTEDIYRKSISRLEKMKIKQTELTREEVRFAAFNIVKKTIADEIIFYNDFIYRGVPGLKSREDIGAYVKLINYMCEKNLLTEEEKNSNLADLREFISQSG